MKMYDILAKYHAWSEAGIPPDEQVRLLAQENVFIGAGAGGPDPDIKPCEYCRAYGGGGHGGLCPNADIFSTAGESGRMSKTGMPPSGGGGGASAILTGNV